MDDMVKSLKRTQNNIICGAGFVRCCLNSISMRVAANDDKVYEIVFLRCCNVDELNFIAQSWQAQ